MRSAAIPCAVAVLVACGESLAPITGVQPTVAPFMVRPFEGEFPVVSVFDHDLPISWDDTNGRVLAWWGETIEALDGHMGYDWVMPEGTPLLAAAAGTVTRAGIADAQYCPPLGRSTRNGSVVILHQTPEGERFAIAYAHISRPAVRVGDRVAAGQVVAYSGDTGCSTGPHLHLQVEYQSRDEGPGGLGGLGVPAVRGIAVDPYGWSGPGQDPWAENPWGARSTWLWLDAPPVGPVASAAPLTAPGT